MKWKIDFDERRGFVRAVQYETYSAEEQAQFLTSIFASSFWRPGLPLMIDYCDLEIDNVASRDIENTSRLIQKLGDELGTSRLALVCDTDDKFGVGRQFATMASDRISGEINVFRDERRAIAWLTAGDDA